MKYELEPGKKLAEYLLGGHAIVTLESTAMSEKSRYISYVFDKLEHEKSIQVSLTGAAGGAAICKVYGRAIMPISPYTSNTPEIRGVAYILQAVFLGRVDSRIHIYHTGTCSVCGRQLHTPKALLRGMGPKCAAKATFIASQLMTHV